MILYLDERGEQSITENPNGTGKPVHQLYASIDMAKNWRLVSTRVDNSSYPNRNLIGTTKNGLTAAEKFRELLDVIIKKI